MLRKICFVCVRIIFLDGFVNGHEKLGVKSSGQPGEGSTGQLAYCGTNSRDIIIADDLVMLTEDRSASLPCGSGWLGLPSARERDEQRSPALPGQ